jgi:hypothetical protein
MPIEVTDILPEGAEGASAAAEEQAPSEEAVVLETTPEEAPAPAPKKRGRPVGSKNKPKPSSVAGDCSHLQSPAVTYSHLQSPAVTYSHPASEGEAASPPKAKAKPKAKPAAAPAESEPRVKRAAPKRVPKPPPVYESESEEEVPLSPVSQRRAQWAAYRQAQVDAHQARTVHYSKALDRMLAF